MPPLVPVKMQISGSRLSPAESLGMEAGLGICILTRLPDNFHSHRSLGSPDLRTAEATWSPVGTVRLQEGGDCSEALGPSSTACQLLCTHGLTYALQQGGRGVPITILQIRKLRVTEAQVSAQKCPLLRDMSTGVTGAPQCLPVTAPETKIILFSSSCTS